MTRPNSPLLSAFLLIVSIPPAIAAPAAPPLAAATCLNPEKPYHAKWLSGTNVLVTATHGRKPAQVRIQTNCIGIDGGAKISVSATAQCLAPGDGVELKRPGEPVQTCRVSKIDPAN